MVTDIDQVRVSIPGPSGVKLKMTMILKLLKDIIGKDLSKFSMPVFTNEPLSLLQKSAEFMFFNDFLVKGSQEKESAMRMVYVALSQIAPYCVTTGRMAKPFNPLLGETYELVTPEFRYFSEMVSHHPPISTFNVQGENFEANRIMQTTQQFNGKVVKVYDNNWSKIDLILQDGSRENYQAKQPPLIVGNLLSHSSRYVEPQGLSQIKNLNNGDTCEISFKVREWSTKSSEFNLV